MARQHQSHQVPGRFPTDDWVTMPPRRRVAPWLTVCAVILIAIGIVVAVGIAAT